VAYRSGVSKNPELAVFGAGVIGLTTAIAAADVGMHVQVLTTLAPAETTSVLATAMVGPTFGFGGARVDEWERVTVGEIEQHLDAPGVHRCRGLFASRLPDMVPPGADQLSGYRLCPAAEIPEGFATAFWGEVPLIDMPPYLEYLRARCAELGVAIERTDPLRSIHDALRVSPLVANCTGLAARELVPDTTVFPLRGPKIVVRNPGIDAFFVEGPPGPQGTSYHPHGDIVVLGGSATVSEDTTPDANELAAIVERCAQVEPRLRGAELLEHRVGLRPGRDAIRLEAEDVAGGRIVHNYGHMGIGVTTAWGCAREAVAVLI
jgi:D-amino-acid oxidase